MAFDKDAFITALDGMSVMELNDLVKAIETKFGVSAAFGPDTVFEISGNGLAVHHTAAAWRAFTCQACATKLPMLSAYP